ncbi:4'-phosphopantetheinyl transferase family protein [Streptomyces atratus]|uniref:4'-phosphopantetheinyl transferase family protein n=1 Tax=Streptomyces atratus TaxID=1893 RepID=UPI001E644DB4|nr:4'-phosphopantetheinyl transferase superfamily protein [Streptomyces atratus]
MCWISISHTSGCDMLAAAGAPVGVDVERARDIRVDELAPATPTPSEVRQPDGLAGDPLRQAFLDCRPRKGAALKAVGVGNTVPLDRVETHPATAGTITVAAGVPGTAKAWSVTDLPIPTPWTASSAIPAGTADPVRLRAHPEIEPTPEKSLRHADRKGVHRINSPPGSTSAPMLFNFEPHRINPEYPGVTTRRFSQSDPGLPHIAPPAVD